MIDKRQDALIQCARALAFTYGGTSEPSANEPEALAQWRAMHAAYDALGVTDTRDLKNKGDCKMDSQARLVHVYLEEEPVIGGLYKVAQVGGGIISLEPINEIWALHMLEDRLRKEREAKWAKSA